MSQGVRKIQQINNIVKAVSEEYNSGASTQADVTQDKNGKIVETFKAKSSLRHLHVSSDQLYQQPDFTERDPIYEPLIYKPMEFYEDLPIDTVTVPHRYQNGVDYAVPSKPEKKQGGESELYWIFFSRPSTHFMLF